MLDDAGPSFKRAAATADPLAKHCGSLPDGYRVEDFHEPPQKVQRNNPEVGYWRNFVGKLREAIPSSTPEAVQVNTSTEWIIRETDAITSASKQQLFFKGIDDFKIDTSDIMLPERKKLTPLDLLLKKAIDKLPACVPIAPSDTVVMKAAFFLLGEGLLNIPDVGTINVKQARAFLWNAAWLQEHMSATWRAQGLLSDIPTKPRRFQEFSLAIIGAGGTGKTAVLKITEALTIFFAGPNTVRKLAPSNAAARLLGGDTLHALCKLPYGNARLASKRGRLGPTVLKGLRKQWDDAVSVYMDEVSMIAADQFLQSDVRLRQAMMQPQLPFGGLALNVCGDFLQLPPVDRDGSRKSLASRIVDDEPVEAGNDQEDALDRQKKAKSY